MPSDKKMLSEALLVSASNDKNNDIRKFLIGAIGMRADGVFVSSRNIPSLGFTNDCQHHAEARLCRKLTPGSTVWVSRMAKGSGDWAMAKPCPSCMKKLRSTGVSRVVYTIGPGEWGVIELKGAKY